MKLIDFHTHVYPEKIAQKATENVIGFYDLEGESSGLNGTSECLIERGKEAGIEKFVIHAVALKPSNVRHINEAALNEVKEHNELYAFGSIHVEMDDLIGEIDYIKSAGFKGVKIHPDTQRFNIDDDRMFAVYEHIQGKLPIMIHCGDPRYDFSHPRRLKRVIDNFPDLTVIGAHLGGWMLFDEALSLLKNTNCFVDICSCHMFMPDGEILKYINGYGAERVLFGSDFPIWDPKTEAEYFLKLDISMDKKEQIAYKNALYLLNEKI